MCVSFYSIFSALICYGSYLDLPRITFAGQFRADPPTANNDAENYNYEFFNDSFDPSWGLNGTGEISFFECIITSVTYLNGTTSYTDPLVNKPIIVNPQGSPPKFVDIDPECQNKSQIFGMKFGISQDNNDIAFLGDWQPSIIAQDMWSRVSCLSESDLNPPETSHWFGSKGTTRITDVLWGNISFSEALQELYNNGITKELSIGQNYFFYTRSYSEYLEHNFTLGYVVGTIGVGETNEPLNFGGERLMTFEDVSQTDIAFNPELKCNNSDAIKMYKAPFIVNENRQRLTVDFGNSIAMDKFASIRDFSMLYLGILTSDGCVKIIANIPYLEEGWLGRTAGVVDFDLELTDMNILANSELVVVRGTDSSGLTVCSNTLEYDLSHVQVLLKETAYFVRPLDNYVFRLTKGQSQSVKLYVTHFGRPSNNTPVTLQRTNPWTVPEDGIIVESMTAVTNSEGVAEFTFTGGFVPYPRKSSEFDELLDIDGQVYRFMYNVTPIGDSCQGSIYEKFINSELAFGICVNDITFLVWSEFNYTRPYTWVDHIEPILTQYYILYPIMRTILNMSDYSDVIQAHNIHLLNLSMRLDITHPSYMPVTRDLSPVKRDMILEWLEDPRFSVNPANITVLADFVCMETDQMYAFEPPESCQWNNEVLKEPFFSLKVSEDVIISPAFEEVEPVCGPSDYYNCIAQMPANALLAQWQLDAMHDNCSLESLKLQLQQAFQLEFYTIPLYLTSLYSIKEGFNLEVYALIRSVMMQEMLHMAQVANILIAVGGRPIIDSSEWAPKYPAMGLPGNVLPQLNVTLEKASKSHIQRVFMGVEYPHNTSVTSDEPTITNSTIGQFYDQILKCMNKLVDNGQDIFNNSQISLQVEWPWDNPYGTLYTVEDLDTAEKAIMDIQDQGEGASPIDPTVSSAENDSLAHFYKFEEIVCGKHLVLNNDTYSYSGVDIPFNDCGVWPMRNNPSSRGIINNTNAYTEARAFHGVYRSLLRKLQNVFSGAPEELKDTVSIMESLQVHGKKLMNISLNATDPNSPTVGPVWDYEWEESNITQTVDPDSSPSTYCLSLTMYILHMVLLKLIQHYIF